MATSIKRQLARKLLAIIDDAEVPALRKLEIGELIKSLLETKRRPTETSGLDSK